MFFGGNERAAAVLDDLRDLAMPAAALERGKLLHVAAIQERTLQPGQRAAFSAALVGFQAGNDVAGAAEALFWLGLYDQWESEHAAAEPLLHESYELAAKVGDRLTQSYAARHLGFAASRRGAIDQARELLRESLELRRELAFRARRRRGATRLAELEREQGQTDEADALLANADRIASAVCAVGVRLDRTVTARRRFQINRSEPREISRRAAPWNRVRTCRLRDGASMKPNRDAWGAE